MNKKEFGASEAQSRTLAVLDSVRYVAFANNGADGWPDVRTMTFASHDGLESLYFISSIEMKKNIQIVVDSRTVVYGYDASTADEFRLFGSAELFGDMETKRKAWCDELDDYFPEGMYAPNLLVIRFKTQHGEFISKKGRGKFSLEL